MRRTGIILTSLVAAHAVYSTDLSNHKGNINFGQSSAYAVTEAQAGGMSQADQEKEAYQEIIDSLEKKHVFPDNKLYALAGVTRSTEGRFVNNTDDIPSNETFAKTYFNDSIKMAITECRYGGEKGPIHSIATKKGSDDSSIMTYIAEKSGKISKIFKGMNLGDFQMDYSSYIPEIADLMVKESKVNNYNEIVRLGQMFEKYGNSALFDELGGAYFKLNQLDLAIKYFEKALEKDPTSVQIHFNLGGTYARKGMFDKALECLDYVKSKNPDKENLGKWYDYINKYNKKA